MDNNDKNSHQKLKLTKIISFTDFQKKSSHFLINSLIILLFLITSLPINTSPVVAQQTTDNTIFLPLVYRNSAEICPDGPDQWLCLFNQLSANR